MRKDRLNIILLGPSGVNKKGIAKSLAEVCESELSGCRIQYLDINNYLACSTHNLLHYSPNVQKNEISSAIERLRKKLKKADINLIGLHAAHLCAGIPVFPCSVSSLQLLKPNLFLTLIDDVYACHARLDAKGYPYSYSQLLFWRQIECAIADSLADACKCDNLYFAAKHPRITAYRLILEPEKPRLYSASQITAVRESTTLVEEIETHRRMIHKDYAVLDPLTIDDRLLINDLPENSDEGETFCVSENARWPCDLSDLGNNYASLTQDEPDTFPLTINLLEARSLNEPIEKSTHRNAIDVQIRYRDFRYIDQVDVISAYRPRLGQHQSSGVAAEKMHATGAGAATVVEYSPPEDIAGMKSEAFYTPPLPGPTRSDLKGFYETLETVAREEAKRRFTQNEDYYARFVRFRKAFSVS